MKKEKRNILIISLLTILIVIIGVAYAAFSYQGIGLDNSELVTGDIYMYYNETSKTININNLMPSEEYSETDYFEFQVSGKNTYNKKDIYYEIVLSQGEYEGSDLNRTIPIDSQLLKFKLVEVNADFETEIFSDRTYSDITNKRIWVDIIRSDDRDYSKTYRLYVRIAEYTNICGGEANDNCDYYINPSEEYANLDWNKLYASIKVNVKGDLEEKSIETDASCFEHYISYNEKEYVLKEIADFNLNSSLTEEQLDICANYILSLEGITEDSSYYDDYYTLGIQMCNNESEFNNLINRANILGSDIDYSYLENNGIITINGMSVEYINDNSEILNLDEIDKSQANIVLTLYDSSCGSDLITPSEILGIKVTDIISSRNGDICTGIIDNDVYNVVLSDSITSIGYCAFGGNNMGNLKTVEIPDSVTTIGNYAFMTNKIRSIDIPNNVISIGRGAFDSNLLTDIKIPDTITIIEYLTFSNNMLKTIEIPDSVTTISYQAFSENQLTSVEIPDSVTTIGGLAFSSNQLKTVTIGNGIKYIGSGAFEKTTNSWVTHEPSNLNLETITFLSKNCDEIKNIEASSTDATKYFPWLNKFSPYYQEGYKATIIGADGECVY